MQRTPQPVACYYGWPSMVNGSDGDTERAAGYFEAFEATVLGDATLTPSGDPRAGELIARLGGRCRVFGYLSLGLGPGQPAWSDSSMARKFEQWVEMGASGLFLDCSGRDFGVSPRRLARAIDAAHRLDVPVVVNAWDPLDLLAPGITLHGSDGYLAENDVLRGGEFRLRREYRQKLQEVERCRRWLGISVWATGTLGRADGAGTYEPELVDRIALAWAAAEARPPDYLAIADPLYGAPDSRMPLPPHAGRPNAGATGVDALRMGPGSLAGDESTTPRPPGGARSLLHGAAAREG
ncbi:MAG TPA: hypothetical protein VMU76_06210 [Acidimicrobiales bacterium]|nr:hypothetical protein [Acidimicrobiales bacterium]